MLSLVALVQVILELRQSAYLKLLDTGIRNMSCRACFIYFLLLWDIVFLIGQDGSQDERFSALIS